MSDTRQAHHGHALRDSAPTEFTSATRFCKARAMCTIGSLIMGVWKAKVEVVF